MESPQEAKHEKTAASVFIEAVHHKLIWTIAYFLI